MSIDQDVIQLRARVKELEDRLQFVYAHLRIEYLEDSVENNKEIIAMIKAGNKIGAIKVYREIYKVGLAEAKDAVDLLETKYL